MPLDHIVVSDDPINYGMAKKWRPKEPNPVFSTARRPCCK